MAIFPIVLPTAKVLENVMRKKSLFPDNCKQSGRWVDFWMFRYSVLPYRMNGMWCLIPYLVHCIYNIVRVGFSLLHNSLFLFRFLFHFYSLKISSFCFSIAYLIARTLHTETVSKSIHIRRGAMHFVSLTLFRYKYYLIFFGRLVYILGLHFILRFHLVGLIS